MVEPRAYPLREASEITLLELFTVKAPLSVIELLALLKAKVAYPPNVRLVRVSVLLAAALSVSVANPPLVPVKVTAPPKTAAVTLLFVLIFRVPPVLLKTERVEFVTFTVPVLVMAPERVAPVTFIVPLLEKEPVAAAFTLAMPEVIFTVFVIAALMFKVPPLTVAVPVPRALIAFALSVPALTVTPPLKVLLVAVASVVVPTPVLVSPNAPVIDMSICSVAPDDTFRLPLFCRAIVVPG